MRVILGANYMKLRYQVSGVRYQVSASSSTLFAIYRKERKELRNEREAFPTIRTSAHSHIRTFANLLILLIC